MISIMVNDVQLKQGAEFLVRQNKENVRFKIQPDESEASGYRLVPAMRFSLPPLEENPKDALAKTLFGAWLAQNPQSDAASIEEMRANIEKMFGVSLG